jgi:hypothetical protein
MAIQTKQRRPIGLETERKNSNATGSLNKNESVDINSAIKSIINRAKSSGDGVGLGDAYKVIRNMSFQEWRDKHNIVIGCKSADDKILFSKGTQKPYIRMASKDGNFAVFMSRGVKDVMYDDSTYAEVLEQCDLELVERDATIQTDQGEWVAVPGQRVTVFNVVLKKQDVKFDDLGKWY